MSTFRRFDLNQEPLTVEFIRSGIRGLDQLFGGGLPYNQLIFIEEDEFGIYSNLLLKSVSSQVLYENIHLNYFTDNVPNDKTSFLMKLPTRCKSDSKPYEGPKDMQIAFRYNYMPSLEVETGYISDFGRLFDESSSRRFTDYTHIYPLSAVDKTLKKLINQTNSMNISPDNKDAVCPSIQHLIVIDHLSSTSSHLSPENICFIMQQLKSYVRQLAKCTMIVTVQSGWLPLVTIKRLRNISDSAIQLESFDTLKPSVYSDDYKGALHVHKVTRVSSAKDSLVANLGFQLKKHNRHFIIEKLFLPPDIGETPSRVPAKSNDIF